MVSRLLHYRLYIFFVICIHICVIKYNPMIIKIQHMDLCRIDDITNICFLQIIPSRKHLSKGPTTNIPYK